MYTNAYTSLHSLARRRCQRYLHGSLNGMRPFSFLDPNFFPYISISRCCKGATEMSTEPTSLTERYATFFIFRSKFFPPISQFLDAVQARRRCQRNLQGALNGMQPFSFLDPNFFAPISQFLDAAQARRRCQRHLQGALNSMRFLTFLDPNYPPNISISRCGTGATEMSTAPTRCPQQYATIFIFRSFFFSISRILDVAWGLRGSERQLHCALNSMGSFSFFGLNFFSISRILDVARTRWRCQRHLRGDHFHVSVQKIFSSISRIQDVPRGRQRNQRHLHCAQNSMGSFLFFGPKIFFFIARMLDVARARRWCQRHLHCALNSMRSFSFFGKIFFLYLEFWMWHGRDGGVNGTYTVP